MIEIRSLALGWQDRQLTFTVELPKLTPEDERKLAEAYRTASGINQ